VTDHHMTTQHVDSVINELRSRRLEHGDNPDPAVIRWAWDELPCILDELDHLRASLRTDWGPTMTDVIDHDLAEIKRRGYPCSSSEFWWLVEQAAALRERDTELVEAQAELEKWKQRTARCIDYCYTSRMGSADHDPHDSSSPPRAP
jgi:hypothetical protein